MALSAGIDLGFIWIVFLCWTLAAFAQKQDVINSWITPRCDGIEATPYFERLELEDQSKWVPYQLRAGDRSCVYETLSDERLNDCMQNNWLMYIGGSNLLIQSHYLLMDWFFDNPQRSIEYTTYNYSHFDHMYTTYSTIPDIFGGIFNFSDPLRQEICAGAYDDCKPMDHIEGYGYFTSVYCVTHSCAREKLETILENAEETLPSPSVFFGIDSWLNCCYNHVSGAYTTWCSTLCEIESGLYRGLPVRQMTVNKLIDNAAEDFALLLDLFKDKLPGVKEVFQESRQFAHRFQNRFTPEICEKNGWPKVTFFRNVLNFDRSREGSMQQGGHWHARHAVLLNKWRVDHVCRDNRAAFSTYKVPAASFPESCRVRPGSPFYHIPMCEQQDTGFEKIDDVQLKSIVPENETFIPEIPISSNRLEYESSLTSSSVGSYHNILAIISALVLLVGEIYRRLTLKDVAIVITEAKNVVQKEPNDESTATPSSYLRTIQEKEVELGSQTEEGDMLLELVPDDNIKVESISEKTETEQVFPIELERRSVEIPLNTKQDEQKGISVVRKKLSAIGMARFVASVHIVLGHLANGFTVEGARLFPLPDLAVFGWGFSWVPFFMMLSGFILTYARINSKNPDRVEPWIHFTLKRIRSIYPLFLCGLLTRAGQIAGQRGVPFSIGTPGETILQLLLLQSWFPKVVVQGLQAHCWFLSCIVPYWAAHQWTYSKLAAISTQSLWMIVFVVTFVPCLLLTLIPLFLFGQPIDWYSAWDGWSFTEPIGYAVAILKFHPLCYFHIYAFGIVTAILMHRKQEHSKVIQTLFRNGAFIGFVGLYCLFFLSEWVTFPGYKLIARLGILAPLQGLYLIGLSMESDPIARLFSLSVFAPLENLSYPQYVFQFIAFFAWNGWLNIGFWLWLSALAMLGYFFVQKPLKSASQPKKIQAAGLLNIGLVVAFVSVLGATFREEAFELADGRSAPKDIPTELVLENNETDIELNQFLGRTDFNGDYINPSLLWDDQRNEMLLAVRGHKLMYEERRVSGYLYQDYIWTSSIEFGKVDPDTLEPISDFVKVPESTIYMPCKNPEYTFVAGNSSYSRSIVTGQEDPRLALVNGQVILTSNIYKPVRASANACDVGRRMVLSTLAGNSEEARLLWSPYGLKQATEKNWLTFEHDGQVKFIQNIYPFTVVRVDSSDLLDGNITVAESSVLVAELADIFEQPYEIHGGSNPIKVLKQDGSFLFAPSNISVESYIGTFHIKTLDDVYINYFFEFGVNNSTQLFEIFQISAPISLLEASAVPGSGVSKPMTFLSGLTANHRGVFVSYGSSNVQARVRFIPWFVLNNKYF